MLLYFQVDMKSCDVSFFTYLFRKSNATACCLRTIQLHMCGYSCIWKLMSPNQESRWNMRTSRYFRPFSETKGKKDAVFSPFLSTWFLSRKKKAFLSKQQYTRIGKRPGETEVNKGRSPSEKMPSFPPVQFSSSFPHLFVPTDFSLISVLTGIWGPWRNKTFAGKESGKTWQLWKNAEKEVWMDGWSFVESEERTQCWRAKERNF